MGVSSTTRVRSQRQLQHPGLYSPNRDRCQPGRPRCWRGSQRWQVHGDQDRLRGAEIQVPLPWIRPVGKHRSCSTTTTAKETKPAATTSEGRANLVQLHSLHRDPQNQQGTWWPCSRPWRLRPYGWSTCWDWQCRSWLARMPWRHPRAVWKGGHVRDVQKSFSWENVGARWDGPAAVQVLRLPRAHQGSGDHCHGAKVPPWMFRVYLLPEGVQGPGVQERHRGEAVLLPLFRKTFGTFWECSPKKIKVQNSWHDTKPKPFTWGTISQMILWATSGSYDSNVLP